MSVQIHMVVVVDEHSVKPNVEIGPWRNMSNTYMPEVNTLASNRHGNLIFKEVLDFAEKIQDE